MSVRPIPVAFFTPASGISPLLVGAWWQDPADDWMTRTLQIAGQSIPFPAAGDTPGDLPTPPLFAAGAAVTAFTIGLFVEGSGGDAPGAFFHANSGFGVGGDIVLIGPDESVDAYGFSVEFNNPGQIAQITTGSGLGAGDFVLMLSFTGGGSYEGRAYQNGVQVNDQTAPGLPASFSIPAGNLEWPAIQFAGPTRLGTALVWNRALSPADMAAIVAATTFPP